jgi:hypothetical protein
VARLIRPRVDKVTSTVRAPHPIGVGTASSLNAQAAEGINGHRGTIRYGWPAPGTRGKYGGYVNPPDIFIGWSPRNVAAGTVKSQPGRLPASSAPSGTFSPLVAAMVNVTNTRGGNSLPGGGA